MKTTRTFIFIFLLFLPLAVFSQGEETALYKQLKQQPEIHSIQPLESDRFSEKYALKIEQEVDWEKKNQGKFETRVILCFRGFDHPTVLVTEGYFAHYALYPSYEEELSRMFDANIVVCEYRYFGESVPAVKDWTWLTVDNSLADIHHTREVFGRILHGKWISTGISKGGQTTMFYRATYPNDMDVSVSYVAPLNKKVEDGRHEPFLNHKVGNESERKAILEAQREILLRKSTLLPLFESACREKGLTFQASYSEIYDYCVFELPFALWQWGTPISTIPSKQASDDSWFAFFIKTSEGDYFSCPSDFTPFFIQAARELGYYGYSTKGLKDLCDVKHTKGYLRRLMLPSDGKNIRFDKSLYKRTKKYLKRSDPKHIFIYGEIDPWSASGVAGWLDCSKKSNMRVYVQPGGSHKARINNMPSDLREEIVERLTEWLKP